ncbi:hypothetical protein [Photobacterium damselae]|uniref:hypothetical protein n=1 Tax=Photobacterium damselae TaxID=38293 RepID=UPI001F474BAD|nr:hypothetical protein [Photobacterium damselae]UKA12948.1 hypothetical protein IHC91_21425 [Photobacterium damselae subsp. damselae]
MTLNNSQSGKNFETSIKDSCITQGVDFTRLKDAGWTGENTARRFTSRNICDFILFDGVSLHFIEAKSRKTSLPFKDLTQLSDLERKQHSTLIPNLYCGFMVEFSDAAEYFYFDLATIRQMQSELDKKSFNLNDAKLYGKPIYLFTPPGKKKPRLDVRHMMELQGAFCE